MTRIIILSKPSQLSAQLAAMQPLGLVPSGPKIRWDSRYDRHEDYLAPEGKVQ
jgi:hypothetical protein